MENESSSELAQAFQAAMLVLESIRSSSPQLIADNMPDNWGMNRLRNLQATLSNVCQHA
jgi:hypothetical protein